MRNEIIRAMFWFQQHEFQIVARITLIFLMVMFAALIWMILYLFGEK